MIDDAGMAAALTPGIADAKAYLRIEAADEDGLIGGLIAAAGDICEGFTGLTLIERPLRETIPLHDDWRRLTRTPVRSITGVEGLPPGGGAAFALAASAFAIDIDANGDGWVRILNPGAATRVTVTYRAGLGAAWTNLPLVLRQGVLRLVAHLYAHRDAGDDAGPPAAVAALWRPWRRMRLG
jgi:uncharacterized phiE125 gp8 family phage protein